MSFRRFFRCGGGAFTPSPTPTPTPAGSPDITTPAQLDTFLFNAKGGETATLAGDFGQYYPGVTTTPFGYNLTNPVTLKAFNTADKPRFRGTGTAAALAFDYWSGIILDGLDVAHDAVGANQGATANISCARSPDTPGSVFVVRNCDLSAPVRNPTYLGAQVAPGIRHIYLYNVTSGIIVEKCKIVGGSSGVAVLNDVAPPQGTIVQDNYFLHIASDGIDLNNGIDTATIVRNFFENFRPDSWSGNPDHPDCCQISSVVLGATGTLTFKDNLGLMDKFSADNNNMPQFFYPDIIKNSGGSPSTPMNATIIADNNTCAGTNAGAIIMAGGTGASARTPWATVNVTNNKVYDIGVPNPPSIDLSGKAVAGTYSGNTTPSFGNMGGATDGGGNVISGTTINDLQVAAIRANWLATIGVNVRT